MRLAFKVRARWDCQKHRILSLASLV